MRTTGGNSDELYKYDGRKHIAESLQKQHPDVVTITWKFNRWHHQVNYKTFKQNKLIRNDDYNFQHNINNYGMKIIELSK